MRSDHLLTQLRTGSQQKRIQALRELPFLKKPPKEAIPEIQALLGDPDAEIRAGALGALYHMDRENMVSLARNALNDSAPTVRAVAAMFVCMLGEKHLGYPVFRSMLSSSDESERKAARMFRHNLAEDFDPEKPCAAELSAERQRNIRRQQTYCESVSCPLSRSLEVTIVKLDKAASLTPQQAKAMEMIRQLPRSIVKTIRKVLEQRLRLEGQWDDVDEPLMVEIDSAAIPMLSENDPIHFFLSGESDYDLEHGFTCVIRDGIDMWVCTRDDMISELQNCDTTALAALFTSEAPVKLSYDSKPEKPSQD